MSGCPYCGAGPCPHPDVVSALGVGCTGPHARKECCKKIVAQYIAARMARKGATLYCPTCHERIIYQGETNDRDA